MTFDESHMKLKEDVQMVDVRSYIAQGSGSSMPYMYMSTSFSTMPFGSSLISDSIGTSKLSEFAREQSHDG